ncbi:DUF4163 domain-containing protein [Methylobacterium sp. J-030]|uniref:DUF4163 domain-containing protein n=1 Tax=Methylobacterium sp. J-030 TaxID=2836627 RepID=UPI001FBAF123|nr:DUF4163 domain-containing protein [Methylobacterium sp. J-030]MCJ2070410.1 DUF4163 domain-containing protein [Methylobacterium sp. J-030]
MKRILRLKAAAGAGMLLAFLAGQTWAADRVFQMAAQPDLKPDLAAMPQIAGPVDDAERRINAALKRLDGNVRKAARSCQADGGARSAWTRTIRTPMRGPRFLSVAISDDMFCGGAHPSTGLMAIVYDQTTGLPVDWTKLLPPALTGTVALSEGIDGTKMVTLASKRLHALYRERYRPTSGDAKRDRDDDACRTVVQDTSMGDPPGMMAWLDAKAGGLAVQFDLPHYAQACADTVVIPNAVLRREGAQPVLTDAIEAAHATP